MTKISCTPIGYFHGKGLLRYELPRQPSEEFGIDGKIVLEPGCNYEQALEELTGFERIWVLFHFHEATRWRPKILPTRHHKKVGVFASRAPCRPTPIGMSAVKLIAIKGRTLFIEGGDLLDLTPILDIKPYIPEYDSFPASSSGWVASLSQKKYDVAMSALAVGQRKYLEGRGVIFSDQVFDALRFFSGPNHYNRIKAAGEKNYTMAYKEWRFDFIACPISRCIEITHIRSGFDISKEIPPVHREFFMTFYPQSIIH